MEHARGIALWLAPALLASAVCTVAWHLLAGGRVSGLPFAYGLAAFSLVFTATGSALLMLAFDRMRPAHVWLRYGALLALGAVAGGLMLGWGTSTAWTLGATYGAATAGFWIATHKILYGSEMS